MIWWLIFEKKPFQIWREIWIQVQLQIEFASILSFGFGVLKTAASEFFSIRSGVLMHESRKKETKNQISIGFFGSASVYGKDAIVGFLSDGALKQKKV